MSDDSNSAMADRAQLRRVIGQLAKGDVLMVTRLDRLARSTRDLLNTLGTIAQAGAAARAFARLATHGPTRRQRAAASC